MTQTTLSQSGKYVRKGLYPIEQVLAAFIQPGPGLRRKSNETEVDFDGDLMYMDSDRYWCFKEKGTVCCECGMESKYFAKERANLKKPPKVERFHFNLYGVDSEGLEVMMTKDHVLPVAQGGLDEISNYRTMCTRCNCEKGNMNDDQWSFYKTVKSQLKDIPTIAVEKSLPLMVFMIKSRRDVLLSEGISQADLSKDESFKQLCIVATAHRRILDARAGKVLGKSQNIWQAPNLKLK